VIKLAPPPPPAPTLYPGHTRLYPGRVVLLCNPGGTVQEEAVRFQSGLEHLLAESSARFSRLDRGANARIPGWASDQFVPEIFV
jgi:hypothetical protein